MPVKVERPSGRFTPCQILREKKSQASREGTKPFPQPSSLKISQLPFHCDQQGMLHLTIHQAEPKLRGHQCSQNSHSHIGELKTPASAAAATLTQQEGKKHKQDKNPETFEKQSWESWSLRGGLLVWVFFNSEESFEKRSPHYSPVHHTTFQFWAL